MLGGSDAGISAALRATEPNPGSEITHRHGGSRRTRRAAGVQRPDHRHCGAAAQAGDRRLDQPGRATVYTASARRRTRSPSSGRSKRRRSTGTADVDPGALVRLELQRQGVEVSYITLVKAIIRLVGISAPARCGRRRPAMCTCPITSGSTSGAPRLTAATGAAPERPLPNRTSPRLQLGHNMARCLREALDRGRPT